jgi:hypothetical protein
VRFFAHDGKAVQGPAEPGELMKLPGFDGDTLVCPVGSANSEDWKPALAYPPFREALLAAGPKLAPIAAPSAPTPPPAPTAPCPRCQRANPEDAVYCNACAGRMDGREEPRGPKRAMMNSREPDPEPVAVPEFSAAPVEAYPDPAQTLAETEFAPPPNESPAAAVSPWRKILIASFAAAALASAGVGWWTLHPKPAEPAVSAPAPAPVAAAIPAPVAPTPPVTAVAATALTPVVTPPQTAPASKMSRAPKTAPAAQASPAAKPAAKRARRARKPKPAPVPMPVPAKDAPKPETSPSAAATPASPSAADDGGMMMPGVPRRVPPKSAAKPAAPAPAPDAKTDAASADAPTSGAAEDETSRQVREQFVFCAQLLAQGAYADHFDTCLCADARQAAPYTGRGAVYAAELKKAASAGTLSTTAAITGIVLDGPVAKVTADWKSGDSGTSRTETETWQLDDGLWCRSP